MISKYEHINILLKMSKTEKGQQAPSIKLAITREESTQIPDNHP